MTPLLLPGGASTVTFRLRSKSPVWVERAELNIVELLRKCFGGFLIVIGLRELFRKE